jgi:hypothetical protein
MFWDFPKSPQHFLKLLYLCGLVLDGLDWLDSLMRAGEIARRVRARVPELAVVGARMVRRG